MLLFSSESCTAPAGHDPLPPQDPAASLMRPARRALRLPAATGVGL